ncbi:MAG: hypothetical protein K8F30_00060 [Taibaiella sp.]|nr:hypothetical protein [Taibaiella sp.]
MNYRLGKNKFDSLTADDSSRKRKGRQKKEFRPDRTAQRKRMLLMRCYFFKTFFAGLSYELVVQMLVNEFCISELTVGRALQDGTEEIKQMMKAKTTIEELKKEAPHFSWNVDDYLHLLKRENTKQC